jgi:hypothetical protein
VRVTRARAHDPVRRGYGKLQTVQYRPTTAELLASIAALLDDEVLASVPAALQHKVRVAANLSRILEREAVLSPGAREREQERLARILGHDGELSDLSAELARRLRGGEHPSFERDAWQALVAIARDDLAIAKPGHDRWEGE